MVVAEMVDDPARGAGFLHSLGADELLGHPLKRLIEPHHPQECRTHMRTAWLVGSSSRASASGERPPHTISTICRRNPGG